MQIKLVPLVAIKDIDFSLPYSSKALFTEDQIKQYCKESGRKIMDVKAYLNARKKYRMTNHRIVKFVEAFWRAIFYTAFSILGYAALFMPETVDWLKDTSVYWKDWPHHPMPAVFLFYYHIELGAYIHQLMWTEVSRSDSAEMIAHHLITMALITTSYISRFWRIGSTILLLHDVSDIFLEFAKVLSYTSKPKSHNWMKGMIVDPLFGVFVIVFFVTRLVFYPFLVVDTVFLKGSAAYGLEWGGYMYLVLLAGLQLLHVFWFYLIVKMVIKLMSGTMKKDERSEDDDDEEDEHSEATAAQGDSKKTM